jgi:hypothetical protein
MSAQAFARGWFEVDARGLEKTLATRDPASILFELIQNALDTKARVIGVTIEPVPNVPRALVVVSDDDPTGFADLSHAYVLFAESAKKGDPELRGRFNLGEKLVIARCEWAEIVSTTGGIRFDSDGTRRKIKDKTGIGSVFRAEVRITREEMQRAIVRASRILVPEGVTLRINCEEIRSPVPIRTVQSVCLETEIADETGRMKRTFRCTSLRIYTPRAGERGWLYELGIPVVETGDAFDVDVRQKIPLTTDRDNVRAAYLRDIRVAVLNAVHDDIDAKEATSEWVREAADSSDCSDAAIKRVLDLRFGDRRVSPDPNDREAEDIAKSEGYVVVHGGSLSAGEWENARRAGAILPASKVCPSHMSTPGSDNFETIPPDRQSTGMRGTRRLVDFLSTRILDGAEGIDVEFFHSQEVTVAAQWGGGKLRPHLWFNVTELGESFFEDPMADKVIELVLHEFAHHVEGNHLSARYHDALCRLGARFGRICRDNWSDLFSWVYR